MTDGRGRCQQKKLRTIRLNLPIYMHRTIILSISKRHKDSMPHFTTLYHNVYVHERKERYDSQTIQAWRDALFYFSNLSGFQLEKSDGWAFPTIQILNDRFQFDMLAAVSHHCDLIHKNVSHCLFYTLLEYLGIMRCSWVKSWTPSSKPVLLAITMFSWVIAGQTRRRNSPSLFTSALFPAGYESF